MWLIVDRFTEWAWLVPADEAWDVLQLQHPAAVAQLGNGRAALADLDFDQVMARQAERDAAFEAALRGRVVRAATH